uniref:Flavoprotein domain-containing protein n=1 Tax=Plectus sambesii TaxID=2011161 RepID=A0A914UN90_9BILA
MSDSSEEADSNEAKRVRLGSSDDEEDMNEAKSASDSDDDAVIAVADSGDSVTSTTPPVPSCITATVVPDSSGASSNLASADLAQSSSQPQRPAYGPDHSFRRDPNKYHLLIGVTGSVATIKLVELVSDLFRQAPANRLIIRIVTTKAAKHFFDASQLELPVY